MVIVVFIYLRLILYLTGEVVTGVAKKNDLSPNGIAALQHDGFHEPIKGLAFK